MSWSMYSKIRCMPVASSSATQRRGSAVACVFQNDLQKQQNRAPHVRLLQTISLNLTMFRCDTSLSSLISRNTLSGTCSRLAVIMWCSKKVNAEKGKPRRFSGIFWCSLWQPCLPSWYDSPYIRPFKFHARKNCVTRRMQNDLYKLTHKFLHQSDLLLC